MCVCVGMAGTMFWETSVRFEDDIMAYDCTFWAGVDLWHCYGANGILREIGYVYKSERRVWIIDSRLYVPLWLSILKSCFEQAHHST